MCIHHRSNLQKAGFRVKVHVLWSEPTQRGVHSQVHVSKPLQHLPSTHDQDICNVNAGATQSAPQVQHSGPTGAQELAPQPARRPAGPSSAAKHPLPTSCKQRGPRMSRFAPQGARPAVQTARVHAELGIPAVLPTAASSQPPSGTHAQSTMAPEATEGPPPAEDNSAASQPQVPDAPQSRNGDTGSEASRTLNQVDAQAQLEEPKLAVIDNTVDAVKSARHTKPAGCEQLLQLAQKASEPQRQLPQQLQDPPATPLQAQAYTRQQFDHPGMTPFPGQAVPSWGGGDSDGDEAVKEDSPAASARRDESSPQTELPAPGPAGHTPFPHLAAASPSSSANIHPDEIKLQADSPQLQAASAGLNEGGLDKRAGAEKQAHAAIQTGNPVPLRMLMQHLQAGTYDSPTANRPLKFAADSPPDSSPATPPAQVMLILDPSVDIHLPSHMTRVCHNAFYMCL